MIKIFKKSLTPEKKRNYTGRDELRIYICRAQNYDKLLPLRLLLNENAEKVELRLGDLGNSSILN